MKIKSALRLSLMTLFLLITIYSCSVEWNNPLEIDNELKERPLIKEIILTEENNILIKFGRTYSDSVQIILERSEEGLYVPIHPMRINQFSVVDTSFDKETSHQFIYRYRVRKGKYITEYSRAVPFKYPGNFLYPPDQFRQQTIELKGIRFFWRDHSHNEEGYVVEKDEGKGYEIIARLPANSETYFDAIEGVFNPPKYLRYRLYAVRGDIQSQSLEFKTEYSGLGSPTNLHITDSSSWHFTIEWDDNSKIEDGYIVERSENAENFIVIKKLGTNITKYTENINEEGVFAFRVCAFKDNYYSSYSNKVEIEVDKLIIPTEGLIAYYPFNGNVNDESGYGHNGEIIGTILPISDRFGRSRKAYYFNGSCYINTLLDVSETNYTVSLWIKTTCNNCGIYSVVNGGAHDRHIYINNGKIYARIYSEEIIHGINTFSDNKWHHIVHEYSTEIGGQKLYVDGKLEASGSKSNSDFTWQKYVRIGYSLQASSHYFKGSIDDVRIYNRALSEAEILALFHEGGWR